MDVLLSLHFNKRPLNRTELSVTTFMQGIHNYGIYLKQIMFWRYTVLQPFRVYSIQHMKRDFSCWMFRTFRDLCAVPSMAVLCSSLLCCFSIMLLRYALNDSEMVPVVPVIHWILFAFTFHMRWLTTARSLYICFLDQISISEITTSSNMHVPFSLSRIMMSGLLLGVVLSFLTCWLHNNDTLLSWLGTDFDMYVLTQLFLV
jgi:hypothetical protein